MKISQIALFLALASGLSACSGKDSDSDPASASNPGVQVLNCAAHQKDDPCEVCEKFAAAGCGVFFKCRTGLFRWANMQSCIAAEKSKCLSDLGAQGTGLTVGYQWAMSQFYSSGLSCLAEGFSQLDDTCTIEGKLGADEPCTDDNQCKKGLVCSSETCKAIVPNGGKCQNWTNCNYPEDAICSNGVCKKRGVVGDLCVNDNDCSLQYCVAGKCAARTKLGEACAATAECMDPLTCNNKVCGTPVFPKEGEACEVAHGCAFGLACRDSKCAQVALGDICESVDGYSSRLSCGPGQVCAPLGKGSCVPSGQLGESCYLTSNCDLFLSCSDDVCGGATVSLCK